MTPVEFPGCNTIFGPPKEMDEQQVCKIAAYAHQVVGGSCDGALQIVTAWRPSAEDLERLNNGELVYFSCLGALPPHYLCTTFYQATHPS